MRAVLFDFDGTLTRPGALDFAAVKHAVDCPADRFVLEFIQELPAGARRRSALATLERFEIEGAATSVPNDGAEDVVRRLHAQGLRVGVLTRNGRAAVERALTRFEHLTAADFDVIVTRDDEVAPKPSPDGVLHAAAGMGVAPAETLVVGDYLLDMRAGRAAGAVTAFLTNGGAGEAGDVAETGDAEPDAADCDFVVHSLAELDEVVRLGLPLPQGKLPNDLLAGYLAGLGAPDPDVLVGAAVGEDVAAVDLGGAEVLVAHGDPVTLAGADLARYAVCVNANDIATSGADPRWLLATVLLPPGTTPSQALALLGGLAGVAAGQGIALAGGHTEVSDAVTRPVLSCATFGVLARDDLKDKRDAAAGDAVILTKGLAVEGTALLARELGERLRALGLGDDELGACRRLLDEVSIVPEARLAAGCAGVHALHDVTEGGLATALRELAAACGHGVTVHRERIPVLAETRRLCELLGADPLGLIASGSLLVTCRPPDCPTLLAALHGAGIAATVIGELGEPGAGVAALARGKPAPWPAFATDEAARLLAGERG